MNLTYAGFKKYLYMDMLDNRNLFRSIWRSSKNICHRHFFISQTVKYYITYRAIDLFMKMNASGKIF